MVHLTRELVEILINNLIVPPASGLGDVDGLAQTLKKGMVTYIIECADAPKEALAKIFDKSDRWIYRQLAEMDGRKERRQMGEDHAGYELMVKVVNYFTQLYPREAPALACVHALRRSKVKVVLQTIEPVLNLCVDQGYLSRVIIESGGKREIVYRAVSNGIVLDSEGDLQERKAKVARRSRSIFPMLRAYLQGHPLARCSMFLMSLPEDKIEIFLEKTAEHMQELLRQLTEEADREAGYHAPEPPEFRALFIAGPGPYSDQILKD